MSFESSFDVFWSNLECSEYELPEELKEVMKSALKASGFIVSVKSVFLPKRVSSYNVFIREKMSELKASGTDSKSLMSEASKIWKTLGEEEKSEWKLKASAENDASGALSVCKRKRKKRPGPKKLSGYQMFVKGKMLELKSDVSISPTERMGKIGEFWRGLTEVEKSVWNVKASEVNTRARAEYEAEHPEWSG